MGSGTSERSRAAEVAAWEREVPAVMRPVIVPVARGLAEVLARRVAPAAARVAGARIGPFELLARLGGGGMGEVWKARRGRQLVALKLPHGSAEMMEVLRAEASRLEGLSIAKVVTFIEAGADDDVPFLATHYLRGRTWFEHALGDGAPRIDLALARRIARDVCTGLANLHELRIVHRDVTPKNVFLRFRGVDPAPVPSLVEDPQGRRIDEAVLIDLGVAQHLGDEAPRYMSPGYAAPELLRGHAVGPAADVYALAATLFHVLTGRRFAHGLSRGAAAAWHLGGDPFEDSEVRAAAAHLPASLRTLLAEATRLDPARRPSLESFDAHLADP